MLFRSVEEKSGSGKDYKLLSKCLKGKKNEEEIYNFYAVVVDATYPHKAMHGKSDKFTCTLKVIDQSQKMDENGVIEPCTLVFFGR